MSVPYQTIADMRTPPGYPSGPTDGVEIPRGADGEGPNRVTLVMLPDNPSHNLQNSASGFVLFAFYPTNGGQWITVPAREEFINGANGTVLPGEGFLSMIRGALVDTWVPRGATRLWVRELQKANDPGVAVPGKVYFYFHQGK